MTDPFVIYATGICCSSVCTSLPVEEATERLNAESPTGLDRGWFPSADPAFKGGKSNPCPCNQKPATHKHYLFNC